MARSGTEERQRKRTLTARFNEQEAQAIRAIADRTGLSIGALLRHALLNVPPPRARHRPSVDATAIAGLYPLLTAIKAELGKHGSNLNQIAHHLNTGRPMERLQDSLELALVEVTALYERDMAEMRLAWMQALGQEPDRDYD